MGSKPPAREGISWRKRVLDGVVPEGTFVAASAGDSPFAEGTALPPGTRLGRPTPVWEWPGVPEEPAIPFDYRVIARTGHLIVVDKPHFLPVTGNGRIVKETVQTRLRVREDNPHIAPLHRLDRLTAGLVVCSANPATRAAYQRLFQEHRITKTYRARLAREPSMLTEEWTELRLGMRKAGRQVIVDKHATPTLTRARRVGEREVELQPVTGHTHQLRVAMNHLGAPIAGDDLYPQVTSLHLYDFSAPLSLCAERIEFEDPITGFPARFSRG